MPSLIRFGPLLAPMKKTYSFKLSVRITNFKVGLFHVVKELSKSNQTGYGVSHGHLESKTRRIFATACQGKKVGNSIGNIDLFEYYSLILF